MPCYTPISRDILLFLSALLLIAGCSSTTSTKVELNLNGSFSQETSVPFVTIYKLHKVDNILLAGIKEEGIYKKEVGSSNAWNISGLSQSSLSVLDFIAWNSQEIMVSVKYLDEEYADDKPDLFKSQDGGQTWQAVEAMYHSKNGEKVMYAPDIIEKSITDPSRLFGFTSVSSDSGKSWTYVDSDYTWGGEFLRTSRFHPDVILSGGTHTIFSPHLIISENQGQSWNRIEEGLFQGDATVYDAILHADDANHILAGLGGPVSPANVIRRSTDGGQSWETVYEGVNTRTLAHSARNPQIVYASGRNADGSLFFLASGDFGDTWEMVKMEGDPLLVQVNDMISVMEGGSEVLYFATDQGVFSYRFEDGN